MRRRALLRQWGLASLAVGAPWLAGCAGSGAPRSPRVVVVGGGFSGATAAKYLRLWSEGQVEVILVEPNPVFVSCPISNLVIGGSRGLGEITQGYGDLTARHGVQRVQTRVEAIDSARRRVRLADGAEIAYDRLIVSPGIDFQWENLPGLAQADAREGIPHAWKAGPQTLALRRQLEAMRDGGMFAITVPLAPYRCPPAPYERASLVADYFRQAKPRSKVLILDANDDITSKGPLFRRAWAERYAGLIEYRPGHKVVDVDAATRTLKFEFQDDLRADVLNLVPDMRAGDIAVRTGLATANRRWCEVDFLTFESKAAPNVHVLGDAIQVAPQMPKSGHMANQHGKACAAAVLALLAGEAPNPRPIYNNTCYSFVSATEAMHVASVHRWDPAQRTMLPVPGSGGLSPGASEREGRYAMGWARNIWADTLG